MLVEAQRNCLMWGTELTQKLAVLLAMKIRFFFFFSFDKLLFQLWVLAQQMGRRARAYGEEQINFMLRTCV